MHLVDYALHKLKQLQGAESSPPTLKIKLPERDLSTAAMEVYYHIADHLKETGAYPFTAELGERAGHTVQNVNMYLRQLEAAGYIERKYTGPGAGCRKSIAFTGKPIAFNKKKTGDA